MPYPKVTKFDVAVVGDGPIAEAAYEKCSLHADTIWLPYFCDGPSRSIVWPSPTDLTTRAAVAHGAEIAQYLSSLCKSEGDISCYRIAQHEFEKTELLLCKNLRKISEDCFYEGTVHVPTSATTQTLTYDSSVIQMIESVQNGITLTLKNRSKIQCEIVILASEMQIPKLLPSMASVCIETRIPWSVYSARFVKPTALRFANSQLSAVLTDGALHICGPNFLADLSQQKSYILQSIPIEFNKVTSESIKVLLSLEHGVHSQCYPYDELPLLGEAGKSGRVLIATGFVNYQASVASSVGRILCDLVTRGTSSHLHEKLHPRRYFF